MIPCVSLAETSVLGNMKERVKEMKVFGCRLNFWNNISQSLTSSKGMWIISYNTNKFKYFFVFLLVIKMFLNIIEDISYNI